MSNYLRKTYFCPTNYRSVDYGPIGLTQSLFSPPGLEIAIIVLSQPSPIRSVHAHDIDLTAIQVLIGQIGVGSESNPLAIGREACSLRIISIREFLQIVAINIHSVNIVLKRTSHIE